TVTADAADVHGTDLAPSPDAAPDAGSTDGALMDGGTADAGPSVGDVPMDGTDVGMDGPIADVGTDGASMEGSAPDAVPPDGACVPACVSERSCTDGRCQDAWLGITTTGAPSRRGYAGIAVAGSTVMIWGGDQMGVLGDGARFDLDTRHWTPMAMEGAPAARADHVMLWTGHEVVVWGGRGPLGVYGDGARYDPVTDRWRPTTSVGAPSPRSGA